MIKLSGVLILSCMAVAAYGSTLIWDSSVPVAEKIRLIEAGEHHPVWEFNAWVNSFLFPESFSTSLAEKLGVSFTHYLLSYLRDLLGGMTLYFVTGGLWHYWIYNVKGKEIFLNQGWKFPSNETIKDQILLAVSAMFMYAALPVFAEWLVVNNLTKGYFYIDEIGGWTNYLIYTAIYLFFVEIGVYWMHRELHDQKWAYKYIHALHHKYNRPDTLSPWASVAFNPLDGILQASPYVVCLFFIPCHYLTHLTLVFATAVWATNIHDALECDTEPMMGSKYHTMHHTHYHCNFGQYTIFADWLWGTLRKPAPREKQL